MPASSFNLPYGSHVARERSLPENGNWQLSTAILLLTCFVPYFRLIRQLILCIAYRVCLLAVAISAVVTCLQSHIFIEALFMR